MTSDADIDLQENYVQYKDREAWRDLKPIEQNDGPHPVVKIAYSSDFVDVYNYFRGVVAVDELTQRALTLTEDAIHMNAANYTVWQYRRRILEHLECDLEDELLFCREMIEANPKNYQVWHHRRVIVGWMGDGRHELRLTAIIFAQDAKNYHAWEHRQWALRTFGLYEGELDFTDQLLTDDVRNNSAWNHRYFVLSRTTGLTTDVLRSELAYARQAITRLQDNESPWSYLKGLLQDTDGEEQDIEACWRDTEAWCWKLLSETVSSFKSKSNGTATEKDDLTTTPVDAVESAASGALDHECPSLVANAPKGSVSPHLLIGLLDCVAHRLEKLPGSHEKQHPLQTALELCDSLADTHDTIRCRYWRYERRRLLEQHSATASSAAAAASTSAGAASTPSMAAAAQS